MFAFKFHYFDRTTPIDTRNVSVGDPAAYPLPVLSSNKSEWFCLAGKMPIDTWSTLLYAANKYSAVEMTHSDWRHLHLYEREKYPTTPALAERANARVEAWLEAAHNKLEPLVARVRTYNRFEGAVLFFLTMWTIIGLCPVPAHVHAHKADAFVRCVLYAMALFVSLSIAFGMSLKQSEAYRSIMALNLGTEEQVVAACERHDYNVRAVVKELVKE